MFILTFHQNVSLRKTLCPNVGIKSVPDPAQVFLAIFSGWIGVKLVGKDRRVKQGGYFTAKNIR